MKALAMNARIKREVTQLAELANERDTTLYKIAKESGIPRATIYYWAAHPEKIDLGTAQMLAGKLGITLVELVARLESQLKVRADIRGGHV